MRLRQGFSFANVMSVVAVFIALGGGAYAAVKANSVGTKQLKKNAVVSKKVKDGSLLAADFAPDALSAGSAGQPGETGPAGPRGATGPQGSQGIQGVQGQTGPSGSLTSSGYGSSNSSSVLTTSPTDTVITVSITTQSSGRILASASTQLSGGAVDIAECWIDIAGTDGIHQVTDFDDTAGGQKAMISNDFAVSRAAGTYTAHLNCKANTGSPSRNNAAMNVYGIGG
jgi:hypothetical protein